jgi:hypothetical protein
VVICDSRAALWASSSARRVSWTRWTASLELALVGYFTRKVAWEVSRLKGDVTVLVRRDMRVSLPGSVEHEGKPEQAGQRTKERFRRGMMPHFGQQLTPDPHVC